MFQPDTRGGYFTQAGDYGTLASAGGGAFTLTEKSGLLYYYRADGKLGYVQDLNDNTITLAYGGRLGQRGQQWPAAQRTSAATGQFRQFWMASNLAVVGGS